MGNKFCYLIFPFDVEGVTYKMLDIAMKTIEKAGYTPIYYESDNRQIEYSKEVIDVCQYAILCYHTYLTDFMYEEYVYAREKDKRLLRLVLDHGWDITMQ